MIDLQQEYEHLDLADRHLVAGEKRVADQIIRLEEIAARGQDTASAERTLRLFQDTLEQWRAHRHLILDTIARYTLRSR